MVMLSAQRHDGKTAVSAVGPASSWGCCQLGIVLATLSVRRDDDAVGLVSNRRRFRPGVVLVTLSARHRVATLSARHRRCRLMVMLSIRRRAGIGPASYCRPRVVLAVDVIGLAS
jgi:hypothetical protein